jgi:hypothetical protein
MLFHWSHTGRHGQPEKYLQRLRLELVFRKQPLLSLWPRDWTFAERAKFGPGIGHFLLCLGLFESIDCSLALCDTLTRWRWLDRNSLEERKAEDSRTCGVELTWEMKIYAIQLHRLTETCTSTTSTSQVSWQHLILENPNRHTLI